MSSYIFEGAMLGTLKKIYNYK